MSTEPIFFQPVFKERIWGGTALQEKFGYAIPSATTGECWAISAHPHGQSVVREGAYRGQTLGQLWREQRKLFGQAAGDTFPLLIKILDANDDLSVQVHPDDAYAHKHEHGERGKTECWYIIDCKKDAEMVFGHHALTREQFADMVARGEWNQLLRRIPIKPGQFYYVPSGAIHALCAGTLVLETQQSSDTTYRLYDYDRRDQEGNLRELHLDKALDVVAVPHEDYPFHPEVVETDGAVITTYIRSPYFTVEGWDIDKSLFRKQDKNYMLVSALSGEGTLLSSAGQFPVRAGDHLILPYGFGAFTLEGKISFIVSYVEE